MSISLTWDLLKTPKIFPNEKLPSKNCFNNEGRRVNPTVDKVFHKVKGLSIYFF